MVGLDTSWAFATGTATKNAASSHPANCLSGQVMEPRGPSGSTLGNGAVPGDPPNLRTGARCTICGSEGATVQHPGWAGNHIGFSPFPTNIHDEG
jgi:hypothetical protein